MALKVVSSYTPGKLKVVNNVNGLQYGANTVQRTGTHSNSQGSKPKLQGSKPKLQASRYSPQQTATVKQVHRLTPQQFAAANRREQARRDAIAARNREIRRRRLKDAKLAELKVVSGGIKNKLWDKATFGSLRRERGGRELAVKYFEENEREWGGHIMARQRNYENRTAELNNWVIQAQKTGNVAEYNRRVREANRWLEQEYKSIEADLNDFTKSQKELAAYAQMPLSGAAASLGRGVKSVVGGVAGTSFNVLSNVVSQPQRVVNTAKNFVNPNNLRQYYGGQEKKGGVAGAGISNWQQLKNAYNASKGQRILSFSKEDEARRLAAVKSRGWESKVDRFLIKYADDAADMAADPVSWVGAGAIGKGAKGFGKGLTSKITKGRRAQAFIKATGKGYDRLKKSRVGRTAKWLGSEYKPRSVKARESADFLRDELQEVTKTYKGQKDQIYKKFRQDNLKRNQAKSSFLRSQIAERQRLEVRATTAKKMADRLDRNFVDDLNKYSDDEVRRLTRFARNGRWSATDKLRVNKYKRAELTKFLEDYQVRARAIADSEGLTNRAKNYLPEYTGSKYDPTKRRTLFGDKYYGQSRQSLQESMVMREFSSEWDQTNSYFKELAQVKKSIQRNARKSGRGLRQNEKEFIASLDKRQKQLDRLQTKFGDKTSSIKGAIDKAKGDAQPAIRIGKRGITTNLSKKGFANSAADLAGLPMTAWKKSVLKYNPAWYVNNLLWNIPASVSAGGPGVFKQYAKLLTSSKYRAQTSKLPEGVLSKISQEVGKASLASGIENTSRKAAFLANKAKGKSDKEALKITNRWLFDYTTKNWERPIKQVLPFWQWQKNLIRLGATMPITNPRSAKVYSELYNKFYKRPYENLPDEVQTYTDPETGKTESYNPKEAYKGKAFLGNDKDGNPKFAGIPSFAVNPETMLNFGVNPYLLAASDYSTSSDRFGRSNTDRPAWSLLGERFPQVNLGRNYAKRNKRNDSLWFSQSGNSKSKQGYDKEARNYDPSLDERIPYENSKKSFFGIPRVVKMDKKAFAEKKRLTEFNQAFFKVDWDKKEEADYKGAQKEKEALARKYGFDLEKDIYDNHWSKYDTSTTERTKKFKESASKFNYNFWRDYRKLPKGSKTQASQRRPYVIGKFDEWQKRRTFLKNPYYKIPKFAEFDSQGNKTGKKNTINPLTLRIEENESQQRRAVGRAKYQRYLEYQKAKKTGDWSWFDKNPGERKQSPYRYKGKFFKSQKSMDRYIEGNKRYERGKLWAEYFDLPSLTAKKAFLEKHPEMRMFKQPTTQAEWDRVRLKIRTDRQKRARSIKGFNADRKRLVKEIKRFAPTRQPRTFRLKYK